MGFEHSLFDFFGGGTIRDGEEEGEGEEEEGVKNVYFRLDI